MEEGPKIHNFIRKEKYFWETRHYVFSYLTQLFSNEIKIQNSWYILNKYINQSV
jgi:hypothetical protein